MNRLANETSLYLRQHANNPVDWYPWGPEALARARELNRPIFLSIGYSACHWCHVMEHESFENAETAAVLNEHFVAIKVDREERPDIDTIYMSTHHLLTREGGGWPLSVFLTPDLTPFYSGTYFPPQDRYGRPSFRRLLAAINDAWLNRREELAEVGKQVSAALQSSQESERTTATPLTIDLLRNAAITMKRHFDFSHGGFGTAPKFPHPMDLRFLLRVAVREKNPQALEMVTLTLEKMARGGIYDQVGGGFHRYSVDAIWLVPHFEKMLYDNALLTVVYLEAYQVTGNPFFRQIACETLDYVLREMTCVSGGFYSTQDADSEGEEGKFYVWSEAELDHVLGAELAPIARAVYGYSAGGNFEGHNILCRKETDEKDAARLGMDLVTFREKLQLIKTTLYVHRANRIWPGRDEKILSGWNGLMISAFAVAARVLGEKRYRDAAVRAADFVLQKLRSPEGRLFRTCLEGQPAKLMGYLEDYAFLADSLLDLHQATFEPRWLQEATSLVEKMKTHFHDATAEGFFFTADDHEQLIVRTKDLHDGATPAGNSVAALALLRLGKLTNLPALTELGEKTLAAYRGLMETNATAAGQMLLALDFHLGPNREIAILGTKGHPETESAIRAILSRFLPTAVMVFHDPASGPGTGPLLENRGMVDNQVTVYVCENFVCAAPLVGLTAIQQHFPSIPI